MIEVKMENKFSQFLYKKHLTGVQVMIIMKFLNHSV